MTRSYDVLIIGGGIMGCSSAYQLAQRGLNVAVFEKSSVGAGPTGKSSAIIRQHYSNELTSLMALHSLRVFQNFGERIGGESGFTQTGFVVLVDGRDRAGLEANVAMHRRLGIDSELLPAEAMREIMPGMKSSDLVAVAYESESGYADPYLTVNSFAQAARRHGATIFQDTEVTGVRFKSGQVVGLDTAEESYDGPIVLNCAGAWGARVARLANVTVPINSCRVQVAFFRRPPGQERSHPIVADFISASYFRPETGGLTLAGLIDPAEANAVVNPDSFAEDIDYDFVQDVGERLVQRYPAMERSDSTGGYASLYAITPDWHPIIDEVPSDSGFFVCSGFSGHGFKLGPAVGIMVADILTGAHEPLFDPFLFRFDRFAERDLVVGQFEYDIVG